MSEKLVGFNDGCLAAMIGRVDGNGKWELMGISEVFGMGSAEYNRKVLDDEFDDLVAMSSFSGVAYVALKKGGRWGMVKVEDNGGLDGKWSLVERFEVNNLRALLERCGINREDFMIS